MSLVAIRGATTLDVDTPDEIESKTAQLLEAMISENNLRREELVSIIFTATADITSGFPAAAARALGLVDVALLGAQELTVRGGIERCVRILMHCDAEIERSKVRHVYLGAAASLRPDLG